MTTFITKPYKSDFGRTLKRGCVGKTWGDKQKL